MDAALDAGIAIYNAGGFHDAHDAWEDHWLELPTGSDDERLLHGLIQFTAVAVHARTANWTGVRGLASSAAEYLAGLPSDYRGVNVGTVRAYLEATAADPEHVERTPAPPLERHGRVLRPADLDYPAVRIAAVVVAESDAAFERSVIERAVDFADAVVDAREAGSAAGDDRFVTLLDDFVTDAARRELVYRRLEAHVARRIAELEDVDGLFD